MNISIKVKYSTQLLIESCAQAHFISQWNKKTKPMYTFNLNKFFIYFTLFVCLCDKTKQKLTKLNIYWFDMSNPMTIYYQSINQIGFDLIKHKTAFIRYACLIGFQHIFSFTVYFVVGFIWLECGLLLFAILSTRHVWCVLYEQNSFRFFILTGF